MTHNVASVDTTERVPLLADREHLVDNTVSAASAGIEAHGPLPPRARVVVIGGGIIGCSVLWHLTQTGITDAVLVERHQLTSGTTWHAAGQYATAQPMI